MATARKSAGGNAPRKQLVTLPAFHPPTTGRGRLDLYESQSLAQFWDDNSSNYIWIVTQTTGSVSSTTTNTVTNTLGILSDNLRGYALQLAKDSVAEHASTAWRQLRRSEHIKINSDSDDKWTVTYSKPGLEFCTISVRRYCVIENPPKDRQQTLEMMREYRSIEDLENYDDDSNPGSYSDEPGNEEIDDDNYDVKPVDTFVDEYGTNQAANQELKGALKEEKKEELKEELHEDVKQNVIETAFRGVHNQPEESIGEHGHLASKRHSEYPQTSSAAKKQKP